MVHLNGPLLWGHEFDRAIDFPSEEVATVRRFHACLEDQDIARLDDKVVEGA